MPTEVKKMSQSIKYSPKLQNRFSWKQHVATLVSLVLLFLGGSVLAGQADRGFGSIEVSTVSFMTEQDVPMVAKIYRPKNVTAENPAPGILALHGYQSDKEATTTFGTIELARRGYVVLSIDQFGQGYSTQHPVDPQVMSGA